MDKDNFDDVLAMGGDPKKTKLLLPFIDHASLQEVPDPYYGGKDGFDNVVRLINDAMQTLAGNLS